jgi:N-acetylmuramic acid 6-phosphate etherase
MTEPSDAAALHSLATESVNPRSQDLDLLSIEEAVGVMNDEDRAVAVAVEAAKTLIATAIRDITKRMSQGGRLVNIGAGTSGRLGVLDAVECRPTFSVASDRVIGVIAGGLPALTMAVEGAEDDLEAGAKDITDLSIGPRDVVVGLTASGRTPYVVGALQEARRRGALTVSISCNEGSVVSAFADHPIEINTGPEVLTGSTRLKAATAQKTVLNMISTITMVSLGKTFGNLMVDLQATNSKLRVRSLRIFQTVTGSDRAHAAACLEAANGDLKVALLAELAGVEPQEARERLLEAGGRLREALTAAQ